MLPEQFLKRMKWMLGEEYPAFLESYDRGKCHALRINPLKSSEKKLREQIDFLGEPVAWCPNGFYYEEMCRPGRHPYHAAGVYYIQDASAMASVEYLDPQPGERILDLCGAPGGKSTQIGAAMAGRGILLCNEIHPGRAKILSENLERMGIVNAIVTQETPQRLADRFEGYFDKVLVDAPCSGEGMFRKNDAACEEWSEENVRLCARRQDEIMEWAAGMAAPGGRLVYSTCTFAPEEDEGTIARFLQRHPEFSLAPVKRWEGMCPGNPGKMPEMECMGQLSHTIRLWPHRIKGEGHFAAVLEKRGGAVQTRRKLSSQKGVKEKDCREYLEFVRQYIRELPEGKLLKFGDQLYLIPEDTPDLDKLRVLRPGLSLGVCKKNRFEPSHALALALTPEHVAQAKNFSSDSQEIRDYLQGKTLNVSGKEGWYVICVDGYSIGWGKLTGSVMKNHYPKGLRMADGGVGIWIS